MAATHHDCYCKLQCPLLWLPRELPYEQWRRHLLACPTKTALLHNYTYLIEARFLGALGCTVASPGHKIFGKKLNHDLKPLFAGAEACDTVQPQQWIEYSYTSVVTPGRTDAAVPCGTHQGATEAVLPKKSRMQLPSLKHAEKLSDG